MTWSGGWPKATLITTCSTTTWLNIRNTRPTTAHTITGRPTMTPGVTASAEARTTARPSESRFPLVGRIVVTVTTRTSTPIIRSTTRSTTIPITTRRLITPTTSILVRTITTRTAITHMAVVGMGHTATGILTHRMGSGAGL